MMPLMTYKNMGLMDALKESWRMSTRAPISNQIILMVLYMVIIALGGSIAVTVLFTQPLATFLALSVYEERLKGEQRVTPPPIEDNSKD